MMPTESSVSWVIGGVDLLVSACCCRIAARQQLLGIVGIVIRRRQQGDGAGGLGRAVLAVVEQAHQRRHAEHAQALALVKQTTDATLAEAQKTNGRVTAIEKVKPTIRAANR